MCIKDIIQTLADTKNIVANDIFLDAESSDLLILAWSAKKKTMLVRSLLVIPRQNTTIQDMGHAFGVLWILVPAKYLLKLLRPMSAARRTVWLPLPYPRCGTFLVPQDFRGTGRMTNLACFSPCCFRDVAD